MFVVIQEQQTLQQMTHLAELGWAQLSFYFELFKIL